MKYLSVVVDAEYLRDYKIKLTFDSGEKRITDCWKWLNGEVFKPLKDKKVFLDVFCRWLEYILAEWGGYSAGDFV